MGRYPSLIVACRRLQWRQQDAQAIKDDIRTYMDLHEDTAQQQARIHTSAQILPYSGIYSFIFINHSHRDYFIFSFS